MTSKRLNISVALIILLALPASAQFRHSAALDSVNETGFYHISITPELSSYLKTDLSDLRIVDDKKQVAPFIINYPYHRMSRTPILFDHGIIRKENIDTKTILIIENAGKQELSNFSVRLRSAAAERLASLSGSDNNIDWFVVLDSLLLQNSGGSNEVFHSQYINFPPTSYRFFKLTINNNQKAPLYIVDVTSSGNGAINDTLQASFVNPSPRFTQIDSGRYSLVKIITGQPFQISHIKFVISGPWLFKRPAKLFTRLENSLVSTWISESHAAFILTSDNFSGYPINLLKSETFYILIENGDNPALKISSISTEQFNRQVITQLEKGRSYSLLMNDSNAIAPSYDLQQFQDRIPASTPLHIKEISPLAETGVSETTGKQISKWWIWPVLIAIVGVLSLLALKLTSDMKKQRNN